MAQQLKALGSLPEISEFNSQHPRGGSQPSLMGSSTFWHAGVHADRALLYIEYINKNILFCVCVCICVCALEYRCPEGMSDTLGLE